MKILIVKLSAIGDVIHTLPALNALRRHWPEAHITWLVEEASAPLLLNHPALDRLIVWRRKRWIGHLKRGQALGAVVREIGRFVRELRDTEYDLILDFQALLKSGVCIALARGKRKIGFGPGMEHMEHSWIFLNEKIPAVSMEIHALDRGLALIRAIGIQSERVEYHLPVLKRDRRRIEVMLCEEKPRSRPIVVINPMAKWDTKLWPEENFSQLADRLICELRADVVFSGATDDQGAIRRILGKMRESARNFAGRTSLMELAALFETADLIVTTDTGPMHLAAAVGACTVSLFGPTAPWRTGPYGRNHYIVRSALDCSPCFKRECERRDCMRRIGVGEVMKFCRAALAGGKLG